MNISGLIYFSGRKILVIGLKSKCIRKSHSNYRLYFFKNNLRKNLLFYTRYENTKIMTYEQYVWLSGIFAIISFIFLAVSACTFIAFILHPSREKIGPQNILWTCSIICGFIGILLGAKSQGFSNRKSEMEIIRKMSR